MPAKAMIWLGEVAVSTRCGLLLSRGLHSLSSHDLSVHSATRRDPVITPAPTSLVSNESRQSQLQDVGEARGWAAQTLTTSSTMVVDC